MKDRKLICKFAKTKNSNLVVPVFLYEKEETDNVVSGQYILFIDNSKLSTSMIQNSIIQSDSQIKNGNLANSMLCNFVTFEGKASDLSVGDYNMISQFD